MGKYFGTDGFRGEANVTLTVEHAFKVGRFLGWYYGQEHKPRIVIGKDTRRSSYMFEYALVAGLTASGADAYLLHVTTTPSVSYVVRTDGDKRKYRPHGGLCCRKKPLHRLSDLSCNQILQKLPHWAGLLERKFFCNRKECF